MRVAIYNQMFGICGTNPLSNILGHWAVHFQKNPEKAYNKTNLSETIKTIKESKADVLGICEILEGQEEKLKQELGKIGYKYCFFGEGHKTKYSNLYVKIAIASKIPCQIIKGNDFPIKNEMGGGGGYIHCNFPKLKTEIFCVHLANPKKQKLFQNQIQFLRGNINKSNKKIVLMGDFNIPFKKIKDKFANLKLLSNRIKTCSTTPLFRIFKFQDLDHILVKGFEGIKPEAICGNSDHKLIVVEIA